MMRARDNSREDEERRNGFLADLSFLGATTTTNTKSYDYALSPSHAYVLN